MQQLRARRPVARARVRRPASSTRIRAPALVRRALRSPPTMPLRFGARAPTPPHQTMTTTSTPPHPERSYCYSKERMPPLLPTLPAVARGLWSRKTLLLARGAAFGGTARWEGARERVVGEVAI
mmetsp:Transcript_35676/g.93651  ORF Transcript_35676/g.93651 Transcript_35676/m.93651 type:complete len:124 (-) Transcript_35676:597-968(-)